MGRIRYNHNSFSTGIISSKVQGNTEFDRYNNALKTCNNFLIEPTGGLFKRPGTYYIAEVKNNGYARIIPFSYSIGENYICEFGVNYIRFHTKDGTIKNNDEIYELKTIFDSEEAIKSLQYFQSGNEMYLMNSTGIFILNRKSEKEFEINEMKTVTMPPLTFMNIDSNITFKPDVISSDINKFKFTVTDKTKNNIYESDFPGYLTLTYMNKREVKKFYFKLDKDPEESTTEIGKIFHVNAELIPELNIETTLPNTEPISNWQLKAFSEKRGFPKKAAIFEGRFFIANNIQYPTAIWGSNLQYNNLFDFTLGTGSDSGLQYKMQENKIDEILWIVSQNKLFIGTAHGIHLAGATGFNDEAITPFNFRTRLLYAIGVSELQPLVALDAIFFVDASKQRVHEIALDENGAYKANNLSLIADELTASGIIAHTWQQSPINIYWCATKDGNLCALTYLKNNDIMAWTNHRIAGKNVKIEDLATLRQEENEQVWMIVHREVNGKIKRSIEYLYPRYDPLTQEEFKQFYVDSGVSISKKHTIRNIELSKYQIVKMINGAQILDKNLNEISNVAFPTYPYLFKIRKCSKGIEINSTFITDGTWNFFEIVEYNKNPIFDSIGMDKQYIGYKQKNFTSFELENVAQKKYIITIQNNDISEINLRSYIWIKNNNNKYITFSVTEINEKTHNIVITDCFKSVSKNDTFPLGNFIYSLSGDKKPEYTVIRPPNLTKVFVDGIADKIKDKVGIYINKVYGTTELNNRTFYISNICQEEKGLISFNLYNEKIKDEVVNPVDSSNYGIYDKTLENNGNVYVYFKTIKGLDHFEGQTVSICANGNEIDDQIVKDNQIILPSPAMYVSIGLRYEAEAETVPFQGGSMFGTSVGLVGSQRDITMYLYYSLGGKYGTSKNDLYHIPYQKALVFDKPQKLFTGMLKVPMPPNKNIYNRSVYIYDNSVLSLNILSIVQDVSVSDA